MNSDIPVSSPSSAADGTPAIHRPMPTIVPIAVIGTGAVFGVFGLFFSGGILVVTYTLVRSLYLREVLGEDIPPTRERRLFTAKGTPRDAPAKELKSDSGDDSPESLA